MADLVPAPYASPSGSSSKLLDQVRQAIRLRHYSRRTEAAYVAWIRRFIVFHRKRHPRELGEPEVTACVSSLAARGVSGSTQNQALNAILFLILRRAPSTIGADERDRPGAASGPPPSRPVPR